MVYHVMTKLARLGIYLLRLSIYFAKTETLDSLKVEIHDKDQYNVKWILRKLKYEWVVDKDSNMFCVL